MQVLIDTYYLCQQAFIPVINEHQDLWGMHNNKCCIWKFVYSDISNAAFIIMMHSSQVLMFIHYKYKRSLFVSLWHGINVNTMREKYYLSIKTHTEMLSHTPWQYLTHAPVHKHFLFILQHTCHLIYNCNEWTYAARPLLSCLK